MRLSAPVLIFGLILFAPLPILVVEVLSEKTGKTEIDHLADISKAERDVLYDEMAAQDAEALAHFQSLDGLDEAVIEDDLKAAFYMARIMVRDLVGPTKIIRFGPFEDAEVYHREHGGIEILSQLSQWNTREYVWGPYEATMVYKGDGTWRLARLNIKRRKGILRFARDRAMPTEEIFYVNRMLDKGSGGGSTTAPVYEGQKP